MHVVKRTLGTAVHEGIGIAGGLLVVAALVLALLVAGWVIGTVNSAIFKPSPPYEQPAQHDDCTLYQTRCN
jgi:hypothetical protein